MAPAAVSCRRRGRLRLKSWQRLCGSAREQGVYAAGEVEVARGDAALGVRGEPHRDVGVADVNIGMMADVFRHVRDAVDEGDAVGERRERKVLDQLVAVDGPAGEAA